jgi:hypothetical protein
LFGNELGEKTGAELAQAFASIPAGVTSLDLFRNSLGTKTGADLAQAFAAIPASVSSLNLRENRLGEKTGAELTQAFAAIPAGVSSLDLRLNELAAKTGAELAQAFAAIPAGVSSLDLRVNGLGEKSGAELALSLAALRPAVKVSLRGNSLFSTRNHTMRDELLIALRSVPCSLDLTGNGESDLQRAFDPLVCLGKKYPKDVLFQVLSFLAPRQMSQVRFSELQSSFDKHFDVIKERRQAEPPAISPVENVRSGTTYLYHAVINALSWIALFVPMVCLGLSHLWSYVRHGRYSDTAAKLYSDTSKIEGATHRLRAYYQSYCQVGIGSKSQSPSTASGFDTSFTGANRTTKVQSSVRPSTSSCASTKQALS